MNTRGETDALIRQAETARRSSEIYQRNASSENRAVRDAETQSVTSAEQRRLKWYAIAFQYKFAYGGEGMNQEWEDEMSKFLKSHQASYGLMKGIFTNDQCWKSRL